MGVIKIDDELLEKLANVFIYQQYKERYGWSFEEYVDKYLRGAL